jgi:hypothetical protein
VVYSLKEPENDDFVKPPQGRSQPGLGKKNNLKAYLWFFSLQGCIKTLLE